MKKVGIIGWRGMVGSVLVERMRAERDFDLIAPTFFSTSQAGGRVMLLGGEAFATRRHAWWNFVSSSRDRIEQAKDDWRDGRFGKVPGDEDEFIPIPQIPLTNSDTGREE